MECLPLSITDLAPTIMQAPDAGELELCNAVTFGAELVQLSQSASFEASGDIAPLHLAAQAGDITQITELVEAGACVDAFSCFGTPLHHASLHAQCRSIEALLEAGAHIDALSPEGLTPLMCAAVAGHSAAVSLLVHRGANLELAFLPGTRMNVLHVCVDQDMRSACAAILQSPAGPSLALCPSSALKPVHSAALNSERESETELINMLLPHSGIDPNISRAELIQQAKRLADATGAFERGSDTSFGTASACEPSTPLPGTAAPATDNESAKSHWHFFNSTVSPPTRLCFTPTANLDCCAADCSPSSRFEASPVAASGGASPMTRNDSCLSLGGGCEGAGMQWDLVAGPVLSLRVKTRVAESPLIHSSHHSGMSSQTSSTFAIPRVPDSATPSGGGSVHMLHAHSSEDGTW